MWNDYTDASELPKRDHLSPSAKAAFKVVRDTLLAEWGDRIVKSSGTVEDWVLDMLAVEVEMGSRQIDECCSEGAYGLMKLKTWVKSKCAKCHGTGETGDLIEVGD